MVREYLEECLQQASGELKKVAEEYEKQRQLESLLSEKIEKSKWEGENNFSAFFPRTAQKDGRMYMSRLCEERDAAKDKLDCLKAEKEKLEKDAEKFEVMLKEVQELEKRQCFT